MSTAMARRLRTAAQKDDARAQKGFKCTEVGLIPEAWACESISNIASNKPNAIVGGPFGSDLVSSDYVPTGVPVIRGQNMGRRYVSGAFVFVTHSKAKRLSANLARFDDLIFTQRGTLGQVSLVPTGLTEEYMVSQSQMKVSLNRLKALPEFVYHYFASAAGQKQIIDSAIQTGVPHTNLGILKSYKIPLPSIQEQERIARALSDADALIESLEQLVAKKRAIKQGAMQELLTGKQRLTGFKGEWQAKRLGELLLCAPDSGIKAPAGPYDLRYPTYIRITDITEDGRFSSEDRVCVNHPASDRFMLRKGDIVLARTGASTGKSYLYDDNDGPLVFAGFLIRVRPDEERLSPAYLGLQLQSEYFRRWVKENSARTGQPGINGKQYAALTIRLPPTRVEQDAIAAALTEMEIEIRAIEAQLAKARQVKQGMMQELLTGRVRLV